MLDVDATQGREVYSTLPEGIRSPRCCGHRDGGGVRAQWRKYPVADPTIHDDLRVGRLKLRTNELVNVQCSALASPVCTSAQPSAALIEFPSPSLFRFFCCAIAQARDYPEIENDLHCLVGPGPDLVWKSAGSTTDGKAGYVLA